MMISRPVINGIFNLQNSGESALHAIVLDDSFSMAGSRDHVQITVRKILNQIFLIYYGIAQFELIRESFVWSFFKEAYWCAILALTLNTCAYSSEIIRGGIQSVPFGQIESAKSTGMSGFLLYRRIILPIAFRQALPAYGNEIILMVKATSLVSTITIMDVTGIARLIIAKTFSPVEIFIVAGLIYLTINFIVTRLVNFCEIKLTPYLRRAN